MFSSLPDWALLTAAIAVLALSLPLLYLSLFRDRSRGRARCPRCWYDLSGLLHPLPEGGGRGWVPPIPARSADASAPSHSAPLPLGPSVPSPPTCPECGHTARRPRDLFRTRRRRVLALIALLLLLSSPVLALWPAVRRNGFWPTMPTTVLLAVESLVGVDAWESLSAARFARMYEGGHSQWQWESLIRRAGIIDIRTRWPAGASVRVPDRFTIWFRSEFGNWTRGNPRISITPRHIQPHAPRLSPESPAAPTLTHESVWTDNTVVIDTPAHAAEFDVSIWDSYQSTSPSLQFTMSVPLIIGGTLDNVLPPLKTTPALEKVNPRIQLLPSSGRLVCTLGDVHPSVQVPGGAVLSGAFYDPRVEIRFGDQVVATARGRPAPDLPILFVGDTDRILKADLSDPRWQVVLIDDPEMALLDPRATARCVGTISIPLRDTFNRRAP